jgi:serine/threonine-protein kinase
MTAVVSSLAGQTLGRYRLVEKLGQGGMATVYRAEDPTLGREVAIKVMHPFIAERSEAGSRFEREAKAVAALRHANILHLHDYAPATAAEPAYLVMELLTGPSLHCFLVDHGAPLAEVAAMLGLRIAQALAAAHAHGIVHRDVKPENVMFDHHRVVLCDFGVARLAAGEGVTATGAVIGSPAYMSPEQARGGEIDVRSDQFSLGALLYQLTTGALPFSASSPLATMARIVRGEHTPPSQRNPRVPAYVERVIERCLAVEPEARFASTDACAEALRSGLADDGFVDVDAELAAYVRDPGGYNGLVEARIVAAALAQAERAQARGETARALAAANRVLAWRPDEPRALALATGLQARSRRLVIAVGAAVAVAGVAALAVAGGFTRGLHVESLAPPLPVNAAPKVAIVASTPATPATIVDGPAPARVTTPEPAIVTGTAAPPTVTTAEQAAATPSPSHAPPTPSGKKHRVLAAAPANSPPPRSLVSTLAMAPVPVAPVAATPAPSSATGGAPAPSADAPAHLTVATAPWCDLRVDGAARGRTPQTLALPPGRHHLECTNPAAGRSLVREVDLAPGARQELRERLWGTVRITPALVHADAFAVDDGPVAAGARDVAPGRRRITFYAGGKPAATRYLDVPPEGCRLVDSPAATCDKP